MKDHDQHPHGHEGEHGAKAPIVPSTQEAPGPPPDGDGGGTGQG